MHTTPEKKMKPRLKFFHKKKRMLPVRCFTCNKVIGCYEFPLESFKKKYAFQKEEDMPYTEFFDEFRITRYCCRKIILTHVDIYQHDMDVPMEHVEVRKNLEVEKIVIAE